MTSILTNSSAMVALQTLTATQKNLTDTQNAISTGLKVQNAKDNASTWTVATRMRSDVMNLQQVSTNLGSADSIVGVALAAADTVTTLISQIRAKITDESLNSNDAEADQADIKSFVDQITQAVKGASYNGVNLLDGSLSGGISVASTIVSNTGGLSQVSFIAVDPKHNLLTASGTNGATGALAGLVALETQTISSGTGTTGASGNLQAQLQIVDAAANIANSVAAALGSAQANIEGQKTYVDNLADTLQTGVSTLVDADMTAESARLSALQTQQQLGTQALSIANQAPQAILSLFR